MPDINTLPTYEELQQRLETAEEIIDVLQHQQVDAIIGKDNIVLLKLQEVKEELRRSEEWRSLAVEASGVGLWEFDPAINEIYCSERLYEMLGLKDETTKDLTGIWARIHPEDRERLKDVFLKAMQPSDSMVFQINFRILHPSGRIIWVESRGKTTFRETPEGPQAILVRGAILDITIQKHFEHELQKLNQTLEQRVSERTAEAEHRASQIQKLACELSGTEERERRRIAGILHDDLQQLLAALKFRLDMLTSFVPRENGGETHAEAMEQIIDECIEKSRNLSHELDPPALRNNSLIAALESLCRDAWEKYGLQVDYQPCDTAIDSDIKSLSPVLYRCVSELLFNIRKHSGIGRAHVTTGLESGRFIIRVGDEGKGMDMCELKKKRENPQGLGLFAIEERIRILGGDVEIDSAPGKGFHITICIPVNRSD